MSNEVKITASGAVGSGKSALLGEIENLLIVLGVPVRYEDAAAAKSEKGLTHADWLTELQATKPSVVLIEKIERASTVASAEPSGELPPLPELPVSGAMGYSFKTDGRTRTVNQHYSAHQMREYTEAYARAAIASSRPKVALTDEKIIEKACIHGILGTGKPICGETAVAFARAIEAASGPNVALVEALKECASLESSEEIRSIARAALANTGVKS